MLQRLWRELNTTWLTYYHARSPATLLGPCQPLCTEAHWRKQGLPAGSSGGPKCGVPGCIAPPPPPTPFPPSNATNCTFAPNQGYNQRIGTVNHVKTKEECCRQCFLNAECEAAAWHEGDGPCYLHSGVTSREARPGVWACDTKRRHDV